MHINWLIIALVAVILIAVISWVLIRNRRDLKRLKQTLNEEESGPAAVVNDDD